MLIKTFLLGIIEGLTEFLPVSSTAHLLIAERILHFPATDYIKFMTVAIQSGAMIAAIIFFWKMLWKNLSLIPKIIVGFLPTAIVGLLFADAIEHLLSVSSIVAIALVIGGTVFLFLRTTNEPTTKEISYTQAFIIGLSQLFSFIPGTSRSGATLIGGSLAKIPRETIVTFSFLLAIPTIFGATAVSAMHVPSLSGNEWLLLIVGTIVSFFVAFLTIKWALKISTKKPLRIFGWYRIAVGILLLIILFG